MSQIVFNQDAFFTHLGGDLELGNEILKVYVVDAPARATALSEAVEDGDITRVIKFSHALKGISATIRAERLAALAEIIEFNARKGDLLVAKESLPHVEIELKSVLNEIEKIIY